LRQRGYEVLEAATGHEALRPALKVLFMSGCADDESFQAEGRGGRPAFLSKPFTPAALAWKVRELLDRR